VTLELSNIRKRVFATPRTPNVGTPTAWGELVDHINLARSPATYLSMANIFALNIGPVPYGTIVNAVVQYEATDPETFAIDFPSAVGLVADPATILFKKQLPNAFDPAFFCLSPCYPAGENAVEVPYAHHAIRSPTACWQAPDDSHNAQDWWVVVCCWAASTAAATNYTDTIIIEKGYGGLVVVCEYGDVTVV
jgi:hypothetical protein